MDNLIQSPVSDSNACYVTMLNDDVTSYLDFGSGFTTTSLMKENSEQVVAAVETAPELFKDLQITDKDGLVWFPATITVPESGMVFADGTSKDEWGWSAVKTIPLTEEEIKSERFPAEQTTKMDMKNAKRFPSEKGFIDALDDIGFFGIDFAKPLT
jgi:hypothetical protein|tara:strand:- start:699 stop:1166 length:468 start_codon:yes stop_codon:yes gene_type:complete